MKVLFGEEIQLDYDNELLNKIHRITKEYGYTLDEYVSKAVIEKVERDAWILNKQCFEAVVRTLVAKDYKVIERHWNGVDIIAEQDGTVIFCKLKITYDRNAAEDWTREEAEKSACEYFDQNAYPSSVPFRFDYITMVVNDKRGVVKHHVGCFGTESE